MKKILVLFMLLINSANAENNLQYFIQVNLENEIQKSGISASELDLRSAMTLTSKVIAVQDLHTGDKIGYGQTYCVNRPMRVGIVAGGYADGYPRHAPTGTPILVDGIRTRIIGRVSMDMLHVDLTNIENGGVGSSVIFWGKGMPVDEVAESAGTIGYELLCSLAQRIKIET